ncbi:hypothetical protein [uncultured Jatrophihabitans sp.]|uniref:hypothetical protein n=1 Tax=uncultured Jatrophihabitans sp. TaxID=1610747 RepID=UPI0035CB168C
MLDALAGLDAVLGPYLEREEAEAMPVTSRAITQRQWHQWDQAHNVKSKKPAQLGFEGHWLIDDVDPVRRQTVLHEVPLVPRYLLLWGFGPRYRRRKAILWPRAAA